MTTIIRDNDTVTQTDNDIVFGDFALGEIEVSGIELNVSGGLLPDVQEEVEVPARDRPQLVYMIDNAPKGVRINRDEAHGVDATPPQTWSEYFSERSPAAVDMAKHGGKRILGVASASLGYVAKLFQRRDDDIATASADVLDAVLNTVVDDSVMKGPEVALERVAVEYDGDATGRRKRNKWGRGKLLLVSMAQTQFPHRLQGKNTELIAHQIYQFMLRQATTKEWSEQDKRDLPALAALAMAAGPGDCEARKVLYSKFVENQNEEYVVSGSKYPFAKRLFLRLRCWS